MCNLNEVLARLERERLERERLESEEAERKEKVPANQCLFSIQEKQAALIAINAAQVLANENDKKYLKGIAKKLKIVIDSELENIGGC